MWRVCRNKAPTHTKKTSLNIYKLYSQVRTMILWDALQLLRSIWLPSVHGQCRLEDNHWRSPFPWCLTKSTLSNPVYDPQTNHRTLQTTGLLHRHGSRVLLWSEGLSFCFFLGGHSVSWQCKVERWSCSCPRSHPRKGRSQLGSSIEHDFLVGGLEHFFLFPYIGNHKFDNPNWRTPSFFRGVGQPATRLLTIISHINPTIINHY